MRYKPYIYDIIRIMITLDDIKILFKGAIGSLTFGAYHMYLTTNMINENNRKIQMIIDNNNKYTQLRLDEANIRIQLRLDEANRRIQLKFDEANRRIQLRYDELLEKIKRLEKTN